MFRSTRSKSPRRPLRQTKPLALRVEALEDRLPPGDAVLSWLLTLPTFGGVDNVVGEPTATASRGLAATPAAESLRLVELTRVEQETVSSSGSTTESLTVTPFVGDPLQELSFTQDAAATSSFRLSGAESGRATVNPSQPAPERAPESQDASVTPASGQSPVANQAVLEGMSGSVARQNAAILPPAARRGVELDQPAASDEQIPDLCDDYGPGIQLPDGATTVLWKGSPMCAIGNQVLAGFTGISGTKAEQLATMQDLLRQAGFAPTDMNFLGQDGTFRFSFSSDLNYDRVEEYLRVIPGFRYAEPNGIVTLAQFPNDPNFNLLYGLHNTGQTIQGQAGIADADSDLPEAWDVSTGSTRVVVGLIDSGVDYDHPDLYRNIYINQAEIPASRMANLTDIDGDELITFRDLNDPINRGPFKANDTNGDGRISGTDVLALMQMDGQGNDLGGGGWRNNRSDHGDPDHVDDILGWTIGRTPGWDVRDTNGHGSHTFGTIGAQGNNGVGVAGVNWDVLIYNVNLFPTGGASWENTVLGVNYLTDVKVRFGQHMQLSNNSWGGSPGAPPYPPPVQALQDAVARNGTEGDMLFVAAAGNGNSNIDQGTFVPAGFNLPHIISVAALDNRDARASFSNWGLNRVHLGAAGLNVYSTRPNGQYGYESGTSMASPHVAGAAALAWSLSPSASWQDVKNNILDTVDPVAALRRDGPTPVSTGGRLNVASLLARMGFGVRASTPADGALVDTPPTSFTVDFTHAYDAATVEAGDLTVNDVPADRVTQTSATRLTFEYDVSPVSAEGPQAMAIAQGAIEADPSVPLPDRALRAWLGTFRYDAVPLMVKATNPANDSVVEMPFTRIEVTFNEEIDPNSLGTNDLSLARGRVVAAEQVDAVTAAYTLENISGEGAFAISMANNAVTDVYGNPLRAYNGSFSLDIGNVPFPVPLRSVRPTNSLIYSGNALGIINSAEDQDSFNFRADPGLTITVVLGPAAALHAAVDLYVMIDGVPELLATDTGAAAGRFAVIQPVPTRDDLGGTQEYMIVVRNAASAPGSFDAQILLNTAYEGEIYDGTNNNTLAAAQNIDSSFLSLAGSLAVRGAVYGRSDAGNANDYYSFSLEAGQTTTLGVRNLANTILTLELLDAADTVLATGTAVPTGQVDRAIRDFVAPESGTYYVRVRGAGVVDYTLVATRDADLDWFMAPDAPQAIGSRAIDGTQYVLGFTGRGAAGGGGLSMAIIDGEVYGTPEANEFAARELGFGVTRLPRATWFQADLSQYNIVVVPSRFDFRDVNTNLAVLTNYVRNGGVVVTHVVDFGSNGNLLPGWNRMVITQGSSADINITDPNSGLITGPGGTITNANLDGGSSSNHGYILTSNFDIQGEVILHAAGDPRQAVTFTYELGAGKVLVSTIPTECYFPTGHSCSSLNHPGLYRVYLPNELAFAASLATPPGDWYQLEATEGSSLTFGTSTPGDQDGQFVNILDAQIQLYDANGKLVASDDNSGADGRNALLNYVVPGGGAGTYYVRVLASDETADPTRGEYVLSVTNVAAGPGSAPGASATFQARLLESLTATTPTVHTTPAPVQRAERVPALTAGMEVRREAATPVQGNVDRVFASRDLQDEIWWQLSGI